MLNENIRGTSYWPVIHAVNKMQQDENIYNVPNLISLVRMLMAPVLLLLAFYQQPGWFLGVLAFTAFTDVLDGYLARTLNQITALGAHLDSWGDFFIFTTMTVSAWLLWPAIVIKELPYFIAILVSFTLPVMIGLIKFKKMTSYHTWSVKFAAAMTIVSYLLLFSGMMDLPFRIAAAVCLYAAIEEIAITIIMKKHHVDIKTFWHALKINREDQQS